MWLLKVDRDELALGLFVYVMVRAREPRGGASAGEEDHHTITTHTGLESACGLRFFCGDVFIII